MLYILEDLHWVDPSTLELLNLIIDQGSTARILTLLTCRPEFDPPWGVRASRWWPRPMACRYLWKS